MLSVECVLNSAINSCGTKVVEFLREERCAFSFLGPFLLL